MICHVITVTKKKKKAFLYSVSQFLSLKVNG